MRSVLALISLLTVASMPYAHAAAPCAPVEQWRRDATAADAPWTAMCSTPLVVQLSDDDGDGEIDARDRPDVLFARFEFSGTNSGRLVALDGLTGTEVHPTPPRSVTGSAGLAAADIDGDGRAEIVAISQEAGALVAFENDLAFKWQGDPFPFETYDTVGVADLDQDGSPEIFAANAVFDRDGKLAWIARASRGKLLGRTCNAADIDPLSPGLELLCGNTLYSAGGTVLWSATAPDGATAIGDFDGDGGPEILLVGGGAIHLLDRYGGTLAGWTDLSSRVQPVVADLDGDRRDEAFVMGASRVQALRWDGLTLRLLWEAPTNDASTADSAAAFDFDGDGAAEVVYHDQLNWYIFDGRDGDVLSSLPFRSWTGIETPAIADIDGDCNPEILVSGCGFGSDALVAYECPGSADARPIWNQYTYHGTNVSDDGTVPPVEAAPWSRHLGWLSQSRMGGATPADAGNTLLGVRAGIDVALQWGTVAGAASYAFHRGVAKGVWPPVPLLSGLGSPSATLPDVPSPPPLYFYRVAGVACDGSEGP